MDTYTSKTHYLARDMVWIQECLLDNHINSSPISISLFSKVLNPQGMASPYSSKALPSSVAVMKLKGKLFISLI